MKSQAVEDLHRTCDMYDAEVKRLRAALERIAKGDIRQQEMHAIAREAIVTRACGCRGNCVCDVCQGVATTGSVAPVKCADCGVEAFIAPTREPGWGHDCPRKAVPASEATGSERRSPHETDETGPLCPTCHFPDGLHSARCTAVPASDALATLDAARRRFARAWQWPDQPEFTKAARALYAATEAFVPPISCSCEQRPDGSFACDTDTLCDGMQCRSLAKRRPVGRLADQPPAPRETWPLDRDECARLGASHTDTTGAGQ